MNPYGIGERTFGLLMETFAQHPNIEEVIIFGSRAKGNFSNGSDIDLALKGSSNLVETAFNLAGIFNERLPIPYRIDVLDYNSLEHPELKDHIDRVGKVIYTKKTEN